MLKGLLTLLLWDHLCSRKTTTYTNHLAVLVFTHSNTFQQQLNICKRNFSLSRLIYIFCNYIIALFIICQDIEILSCVLNCTASIQSPNAMRHLINFYIKYINTCFIPFHLRCHSHFLNELFLTSQSIISILFNL